MPPTMIRWPAPRKRRFRPGRSGKSGLPPRLNSERSAEHEPRLRRESGSLRHNFAARVPDRDSTAQLVAPVTATLTDSRRGGLVVPRPAKLEPTLFRGRGRLPGLCELQSAWFPPATSTLGLSVADHCSQQGFRRRPARAVSSLHASLWHGSLPLSAGAIVHIGMRLSCAAGELPALPALAALPPVPRQARVAH